MDCGNAPCQPFAIEVSKPSIAALTPTSADRRKMAGTEARFTGFFIDFRYAIHSRNLTRNSGVSSSACNPSNHSFFDSQPFPPAGGVGGDILWLLWLWLWFWLGADSHLISDSILLDRFFFDATFDQRDAFAAFAEAAFLRYFSISFSALLWIQPASDFRKNSDKIPDTISECSRMPITRETLSSSSGIGASVV